MEQPEEENTDGSSIRPVSSLRSHFENMMKSKPEDRSAAPSIPSAPTVPPRPPRSSNTVGLVPGRDSKRGRVSLDLPRQNPMQVSNQTAALDDKTSQPGTPRSRPLSMGPFSPGLGPPMVTIESPSSPPRYAGDIKQTSAASSRGGSPAKDQSGRSNSPFSSASKGFKIPSRGATPSLDSTAQPKLTYSPQFGATQEPKRTDSPGKGYTGMTPVPPPINRAVKPRAFGTPTPRQASETLSAPGDYEEDKISPFSTPPSEPELDHPSPPFGTPPSVPESSRPKVPPQLPARDNRFVALPIKETQEQNSTRAPPPPMPPRHPVPAERQEVVAANLPPSLPPRPAATDPSTYPIPPVRNRSPRPPPPPPELPRRSIDQQPAMVATQREMLPPPTRNDRGRPHQERVLIPSRRIHGSTSNIVNSPVTNFPPPPLPPGRVSLDQKRERERDRDRDVLPERHSRATQHDSDEEEGDGATTTEHSPERPNTSHLSVNEAPDASHVNRRPPRFSIGKHGPHEIFFKQTSETKLLALCGDRLCTSGLQTTKGWNARSGDLLFTFTHGETVKATALAFKPGGNAQPDEANGEYEHEHEEGRKIWVGTSTGDLQEIDVPMKTVVGNRRDAHGKATITKIHRCVSDLLTMDIEGKVLIWAADPETGTPDLNSNPFSARVVANSTVSLMVGTQLWVGLGKGIWVYEYDRRQKTLTQKTKNPLVQVNAGEVTAGTTVARGQMPADKVYFGHGGVDGKISIYSREEPYHCLGVIPVSLYPIRALVGVGDKLWAGFKTGKVYVYDVNTQPWKVLKDWKAHDDTIVNLHVDPRCVWRRTGKKLPVASMGKDGVVRFWDGMLTDDWLTADLQEHDVEYCEFDEFTASILTWNAGASKPSSLRHNEMDDNFFRGYLTATDPPDVLVFGFQELVDLEDKKETAKSFFKAAHKKHKEKDKDGFGHVDAEKMSHQYRAWRDHLARCIDENMPANETYQLLHTANLVGLFTCIFVKDSFRGRISFLEAAQIKLGMGGLHGNKGSLVVRFLVDDSSVCLMNCHLAAGQSHAGHRNKDLAVIMDTACLSPLGALENSSAPIDAFVAGGDGTMILDHEICVLSGDLNYRIDHMSRDAVVSAVRNGNLNGLLAKDQLLTARKRNPAHRLRGWEEKPITFAPTYKYDVGTDQYDTSEKKRSPAWCDRVLYRGLGRLKMEEYKRWETPRTSDHRPVSGRFRVRVKRIAAEMRERVRKESERRFGEEVRKVAGDVMVDYLVNTLGFTIKDALAETAAALES